MNKELLKKKASEYINELAYREIDYTEVDYEETSYEAGRNHAIVEYGEKIFEAGAEWRINSVWHNTEEIPEKELPYLAEFNGEKYCVFYTNICFKKMAVAYNFTRWAYIDDLLPEKEGSAK